MVIFFCSPDVQDLCGRMIRCNTSWTASLPRSTSLNRTGSVRSSRSSFQSRLNNNSAPMLPRTSTRLSLLPRQSSQYATLPRSYGKTAILPRSSSKTSTLPRSHSNTFSQPRSTSSVPSTSSKSSNTSTTSSVDSEVLSIQSRLKFAKSVQVCISRIKLFQC